MMAKAYVMAHDTTIAVRDWTTTPGARYQSQGNYSGEQYREEVLLPAFRDALRNARPLWVDLDGTAGYATSFLDEAFGGLVRKHDYTSEQVTGTLRFISKIEPELIAEVERYIRRPRQLRR